MREMRRRLGACVRSRGTFRARILTIVLSRSVMTTNNSANSLRRRFFYVSTGRHLNASARDTIAFLEREEMRETRRRLGTCVRSRGTFRARILTVVLSRSVMTTNNSAK